MGDIFPGMELELKPFRARFAKVRLRVATKTSLGGARQPQVQQIIGMQVRELATRHRPGVMVSIEARRPLLDTRQATERRAKLIDQTHFYQRLNANTKTPLATRPMPSHSRADGRSPRNAKANTATSTRLNLSTGATFDASPIWSARK